MTGVRAARPGPPGWGAFAFTPRLIGYGAVAALPALAVVLNAFNAAHTLVFLAAGMALVALAWMIGIATEELGAALGPQLGGIINATFGNAPELIISFFALRAGLIDVVKASITGSILGNLLLVLGASLLVGGLKNGVQTFSKSVSGLNSTLLFIAVIGLFVPAVFARSLPAAELHGNETRQLSDGVSIVLIITYVLSLVFFFTHPGEGSGAVVEGEQHQPKWSPLRSSLVLLVAAGATAYVSEILVGALEPTITAWGVSAVFAGVILVPLFGNIAEHLVGVQLAYRNKMEFSIVVSLGSSLQVALFVAPVLVLLSHLVGNPLDLVFTQLEVTTVAVAVVLVALIALDGESNWFEGAALLAVYILIALAFFFFPEQLAGAMAWALPVGGGAP